MQKFFEMLELYPVGDNTIPQEIRLEITEDSEATALIAEYEPYFGDVEYTTRIQNCRHEEIESCNVKVI